MDAKDERSERGPTVCEVIRVSEVNVLLPRKSKLRRRMRCDVAVSPAGEEVQIITSASNVKEGYKFIVALPGHKTAIGVVEIEQVGEFKSFGRFCGPAEMGWRCNILNSQNAIMLPDSAKVGDPAPSYDEALLAFHHNQKHQRLSEKIKKEERVCRRDMALQDAKIRSLQKELTSERSRMEKTTKHHQEEMAQKNDENQRLSDELRKLQMELVQVKEEQGKKSSCVDGASWKYQGDNGEWTPVSDSQLIRDRKKGLLSFT